MSQRALAGALLVVLLGAGAAAAVPVRVVRVIKQQRAPDQVVAAPAGGWLLIRQPVCKGVRGWRVLDGQGRERLKLPDGAERVAWSPRGLRLSYLTQRGELWTVRPDGTGHRPSIGGGKLSVAVYRWSPDGRKIAFIEQSPQVLCVMDPDGAKPRRLFAAKGLDWCEWSGDSRWLMASVGGEDGRHERLWLVSASTGRAQPLASPVRGGEVIEAKFGDGGRYLALSVREQPAKRSKQRQYRVSVWVRYLNRGGWRLVTQGPQDTMRMSPAPRGGRLAVSLGIEGDGERAQMAVFSTGGRRLCPWHRGGGGTWSPDGRWFAYARSPGEHHQGPWLCDANGSDHTDLKLTGEPADWNWSADSRRLTVLALGGVYRAYLPR